MFAKKVKSFHLSLELFVLKLSKKTLDEYNFRHLFIFGPLTIQR